MKKICPFIIIPILLTGCIEVAEYDSSDDDVVYEASFDLIVEADHFGYYELLVPVIYYDENMIYENLSLEGDVISSEIIEIQHESISTDQNNSKAFNIVFYGSFRMRYSYLHESRYLVLTLSDYIENRWTPEHWFFLMSSNNEDVTVRLFTEDGGGDAWDTEIDQRKDDPLSAEWMKGVVITQGWNKIRISISDVSITGV